MIRRSTLLKATLAFTAAVAMASAHADLLDDIKAAKKIRIAIDLGTPPYGMNDAQMPWLSATSRTTVRNVMMLSAVESASA